MSDPIRSISQNNFLLAAQQEVSHDNTLSGNGTEASPLGLNETVLWSGTRYWWGDTSDLTVSESLSNFETIKLVAKDDWELDPRVFYFPGDNTSFDISLIGREGSEITIKTSKFGINGNKISLTSYGMCAFASNKTISTTNWTKSFIQFSKIVGINRKSST